MKTGNITSLQNKPTQIILRRGKDKIYSACPNCGTRLTPGYEILTGEIINPGRVCPQCKSSWIWRYPDVNI